MTSMTVERAQQEGRRRVIVGVGTHKRLRLGSRHGPARCAPADGCSLAYGVERTGIYGAELASSCAAPVTGLSPSPGD